MITTEWQCDCSACQALANRYESDPLLLAFYRARLLVKGWKGQKDRVEKAYILAHASWAQEAASHIRGRGLPSKYATQTTKIPQPALEYIQPDKALIRR